MSRPNILFIMSDQQASTAMSCADNPWLQTPSLDRLARDGVRFSNAYCTNPLCKPSRSSMLTGRFAQTLGVVGNEGWDRSKFVDRQMGRVFADAGYRCAYAGKWHCPTGSLIDTDHGFEPLAPKGDQRTREACVRFLSEKPKEPFLLVASFSNPHDICQWARNQTLIEEPIPPQSPGNCPPLPENHARTSGDPELLDYIRRFNPYVHPTMNFDENRWRQYREAYFRLCELVDGHVAALLRALDEAGLTDNTLICYTSDHGDGHGAHGWNQKSALYDEVTKIPLLISAPKLFQGGRVEDRLASNGLDLLPTFCDFAGLQPPDGVQGRSLRPLLEDRSGTEWRESVATECYWGQPRGSQGRMIRTERYKYVLYSWGANRELLYDLETDPGETRNLAGEPDHQPVLDDHRRRMLDWCGEVGDAGFSRLAVPPGT